MPLLIPAPTTSAGPPQWRLKNCCKPNSVGGTTDEMIPALIDFHGKPFMSSKVLSSTAYSSAVRSATVWIRQWAASSPSRNTPRTVFVFPTSTASSAVIDRNGSSPGTHVVGWLPAMGAPRKVLMIAVLVAGCGGASDSPPGPLGKHFDDMYIATIPPGQKPTVVQTQQDWSVARMENAKAE